MTELAETLALLLVVIVGLCMLGVAATGHRLNVAQIATAYAAGAGAGWVP